MKTLGLDLGSNSIGWAIIDESTQDIVDMGVRIFNEGVSDYGLGEKKEQSLAQSRSAARQMRTQYLRKQKRRKSLRRLFMDLGWWPKDEREIKEFKQMNPWLLRVKAIREPLTCLELARVFWHMTHLRGYKSNGADKKAKTIYQGNVKGINVTLQDWESCKVEHPTIGSYLSTLLSSETKTRARYTLRAWFIEEFDKIWEFQERHNATLNSDELKQKVKFGTEGAPGVFFQLPLKSQAEKIGYCKYEAGERRAAKPHPLAQIFVAVSQLNNFELTKKSSSSINIGLTPAQKEILLMELMTQDKVEISALLKKLKYSTDEYRTNYDTQRSLSGVPFGKHINNIFKKVKTWKSVVKTSDSLQAKLIELYNLISDTSKEQEAIIVELKNLGLSEKDALGVLAYEGPKGYQELSLKAIEKVLPIMAQQAEVLNEKTGEITQVWVKYDKACSQVYGSHNLYDKHQERSGKKKKLPPPALVANPVVMRILTELRNVVNDLIAVHGKPDNIHLEMARDVHANAKRRKEMMDINHQNQDRNFKAREELLKELGRDYAKKSEITKYNLWNDQKGKCLYSGKEINIKQLFDTGLLDIDHILPKSKTRDDSYSNKVLCYRSENAEKGDKTIYQWVGGTSKFEEILKRAEGLSPEKFKRIATTSDELVEGFVTQQLNDTRYATKIARTYLSYIVPYKQVLGTRGGYTADLRNSWFGESQAHLPEEQKGKFSNFIPNPLIDSVLSQLHEKEHKSGKLRLDHRHHALDALVIALTSASRIQAMTKKEMLYNGKIGWPLPWPNLPKQAKSQLKNIVISFRINDKPNGQLHNKFLYGQIQVPPHKDGLSGKSSGETVTVIRKPLSEISLQELICIVDPVVKELVFDYLKANCDAWKALKDLDARQITALVRAQSKKNKNAETEDLEDEDSLDDSLEETNANGGKKGQKITLPKNWANGAKIPHKNGHSIKKVRVASNNESLRPIRKKYPNQLLPDEKEQAAYKPIYIDPQSNHHACIYVNSETGKYRGEVNQLIDVAAHFKGQGRSRKQKAIAIPQPMANEEFLYSLRINDLVYINPDAPLDVSLLADKANYHILSPYLYRVQKLNRRAECAILRHQSLAKIVIELESAKRQDVGRVMPVFAKYGQYNVRKLRINPSGYLQVAND